MELRKKIGLNTFTLKMIAVLCMIVDHIGVVLFPDHIIFRIIGRIAFPIFAYTLVEGFIYTHDLKKYMLRMAGLAVISEIPFDLVNTGKILEFGHQNVFFTLTLGLIMLYFYMKASNNIERVSTVILLFLVSDFLHTDYSSMGLFMIFCFYQFRDRRMMKNISIAVINILLMGYVQVYGALALIPINLHNREQGPKAKMFFYAVYPVHLLLLFVVKMIL